ncbi:subtilisin-like protein, partial [Myriangium duriaei CBS 260.36]
KYIITLKPQADLESHLEHVRAIHANAINHKRQGDGKSFSGVSRSYNISNFQAYSGHFHSSTIQQLENNKDVDSIEADQIWSTHSVVSQQNPANYGLNRISQRALKQEEPYLYDSSAGHGTFAYVVDTGVDIDHEEFEGRAFHGYSVDPHTPLEDTNGHGTYVAGIIGSKTYGVAKKCRIISVKAFKDDKGTVSDILHGFDWAVKDISTYKRRSISVINISIGGNFSTSVNRAINTAFDRLGITTVVAAGNENEDIAKKSPASAQNAISVGAVNKARRRANDSNWGKNMTLFAPGTSVKSCAIGNSRNATDTLGGTSAAAAHVTGVAVYLQGMRLFPGDAKSLKARIVGLATPHAVLNPNDSPNLFIYN